jgi:HEAT repeat protein
MGSPEPLGVLVRESKTIHVFQVEASEAKVSFKTTATLKGQPAKAPFQVLVPLEHGKCEGLFQPGLPVLCFFREERARDQGDDVAVLFVGGRWVVAYSPDFRDFLVRRTDWSCHALGYIDNTTYEGTVEALRKHVEIILAGRETTITARVPKWRSAGGGQRLWRIKASPWVTEFVDTDESPFFVGWGTGEPDEAAKLAQALRGPASQDRILAAGDLAFLGPAAALALPALRRALQDPVPAVGLAAAKALVRLDQPDRAALDTITDRLRDKDPEVRAAAAGALGDLGPLARPALPALLRALDDMESSVRVSVAGALGRLAPAFPTPREAAAAMTARLKSEQDQAVCRSLLRSLKCFGPDAWVAVPVVRRRISEWGESSHYGYLDAFDLLGRFDPPPVDLLGECVADGNLPRHIRSSAAEQLAGLGPRARAALPVLRRLFQKPEPEPEEQSEFPWFRFAIAKAILDLDEEGGPALVAPLLLDLAKRERLSHERTGVFWAVGRCGAAGRPALAALLGTIEPDSFDASSQVWALMPLLGPEHRDLLPTLRRLLTGKRPEPVQLAEVLLKLGMREEALAQAAGCLESEAWHERTEAAHWLRARGQAARAVEPALLRALEGAVGEERARLALIVWRLRGAEGSAPQDRALAGLVHYLGVCPYWRPTPIGDAVAILLWRLQLGCDPVAVLACSLQDQDPHIRLAAAIALARVDPHHPETVPALRRLLERYPHFLDDLGNTMAALGPDAASIAPLLLPLLRQPDKDQFGDRPRTAEYVLHRIDPALAAKAWGAAGASDAVPVDLGPLWDDLSSSDPCRADLAVWRLAGAGPRAVALLRQRLRPPPALTAERVARLISDLDSDDFDTRETAGIELAAGIESAAPALRRALEGKPSRELRRRIEELLAHVDPANSPEQRRRLRAVRLLAEMQDPDGWDLLKGLAQGDPRFVLTREATAALRRLDQR